MRASWPRACIALVFIFAITGLYFGRRWIFLGPPHDWWGKFNTRYSSKFTALKFDGVTNGMSRTTLIDLFGTPTHSYLKTNYPVWALRDEAVRNRYGKTNEVRIEFLQFSQPKRSGSDYDLVEVVIGPDLTVVQKERWVTD